MDDALPTSLSPAEPAASGVKTLPRPVAPPPAGPPASPHLPSAGPPRSPTAQAVLDQAFAGCFVDSETAILRRVLLHRPGSELERLIPENHRDLLFDDIPWLPAAQREHDAFRDLLTGHGVTVVTLTDLLTAAATLPAGRRLLIDATTGGDCADGAGIGRRAARELRAWLHDLPPGELAGRLLAGATLAELPDRRRAALGQSLGARDQPPDWMVLRPLPNAMFVRDTVSWIGSRVTSGRMSETARGREGELAGALLRTARVPWLLPTGGSAGPATLEGGDIMLAGRGCVVVGVGARTAPAAAESLARTLLTSRSARRVLAVSLPRDRQTMHLDTVMTMVDEGTFLVSMAHYRGCRWHELVLDRRGDVRARPADDGFAVLADVLDLPSVRVVPTGGDDFAVRREQWSDAANVLALRPGVVAAYDRNTAANHRLELAGIEVVTFPGSELARGRGGPHCLSSPLLRDSSDATGDRPRS